MDICTVDLQIILQIQIELLSSLRATGVRELAPYKVASYRNGAIICPSMAASWASATIISKNRGELKYMKVGLKGNRETNIQNIYNISCSLLKSSTVQYSIVCRRYKLN
jgi:hypothetical protein